MLLLQILIILLAPYGFQLLSKNNKIAGWLGPVVLCYALGILLANVNFFKVNIDWARQISEISVVLAIPMLLFSTDIQAWLKNAKSTIVSFIGCIIVGALSSIIACFFFGQLVEQPWMVSGMLTGVYTGGTPNLQAIGLALGASENTYLLLNAADIFCSGIYLILLTSIMHRLLGYVLPDFPYRQEKIQKGIEQIDSKSIISFKDILFNIGLAILVLGLSFVFWMPFEQLFNQTAFLMLMLTTLSVLASFYPPIRSLPGSFETGEYLLLVFCVAVGMLSDFNQLLNQGLGVIQYTAIVIAGAITLHYLFSYIFKIDRDTAMIVSTASIFGPAFVGQVASVIGNRSLIFSGMATGVMGYAVGNYLGIGVAYLLKNLL